MCLASFFSEKIQARVSHASFGVEASQMCSNISSSIMVFKINIALLALIFYLCRPLFISSVGCVCPHCRCLLLTNLGLAWPCSVILIVKILDPFNNLNISHHCCKLWKNSSLTVTWSCVTAGMNMLSCNWIVWNMLLSRSVFLLLLESDLLIQGCYRVCWSAVVMEANCYVKDLVLQVLAAGGRTVTSCCLRWRGLIATGCYCWSSSSKKQTVIIFVFFIT